MEFLKKLGGAKGPPGSVGSIKGSWACLLRISWGLFWDDVEKSLGSRGALAGFLREEQMILGLSLYIYTWRLQGLSKWVIHGLRVGQPRFWNL